MLPSQNKNLLDGLHIPCLQQLPDEASLQPKGSLYINLKMCQNVFFSLQIIARVSTLDNLSVRALLSLLTSNFPSMHLTLQGVLWFLLPSIFGFVCLYLPCTNPN